MSLILLRYDVYLCITVYFLKWYPANIKMFVFGGGINFVKELMHYCEKKIIDVFFFLYFTNLFCGNTKARLFTSCSGQFTTKVSATTLVAF